MGEGDTQNIAIMLGKLDGKLDAMVKSVDAIQEGKLAICQLHAAALNRIEAKLDGRKPIDDHKGLGFLNWGKVKSGGIPAIILAVVVGLPIGIGIFQYYHAKDVAAEVKEEAKTEAMIIATDTAKREHRTIDRDAIRTELLTMIREKQEKGSL